MARRFPGHFGVCFLLVFSAFFGCNRDPKPDASPEARLRDLKEKAKPSELDGTWQTVRVELEDGTSDKDLPTIRLTIVGEKLKCTGIGNIDGFINTDATQNPKTFDARGSSKDGAKVNWSGIYEFEGDTLKLCIGQPGARPKEFKSNPATLWVLKRVK